MTQLHLRTRPAPSPALNPANVAALCLLAAQALGIAIYLALVILPFYANGLHQEPAELVTTGRFDPKSLWPHNTEPFGPAFTVLSSLSWALTWVLSAFLAVLAALLAVAARWTRPGPAGFAAIAGVIALAVAFGTYAFSDTGAVIGAWMAD